MTTPRTIEELERPPDGYTARYYNHVDGRTERRRPALAVGGRMLRRLARQGFEWQASHEVERVVVALARRGVIVVAEADGRYSGAFRMCRLTRKGAAELGRTDLTATFDRLNRSRGQRPDYESNDVEGAAALARHAEL